MKLLTHRKIIGGVLVAGALVLSACGSSGSDASDPDPSEETTTTEASTTTEDPAGDAQLRAESVTLTEADFPEGWTSAEQSPDVDDTDDADNPLKACSENYSDDSDNLASYATDDFLTGSLDAGDGSQFGAETIVFTDEEAATAAVEELNDPEVVTCIDAALKEVFGAGTPGVTVEGEITADDITVDLGTDAISGISGTFEISADDGSTATANVGILAMSTGDVGTMVTILSLGTSLDPTTLIDGPITTLAELQAEA